MSAEEALDAYLAASTKAWQTFMDYRFLRASEAQVARANRAETDALVVLREAIAATP